MLSAKITGMVLDVYNRQPKDSSASPVSVADLYVGHEVVKVAKVDASFVKGTLMEDIPVNIYNGQYGLSVVYNPIF